MSAFVPGRVSVILPLYNQERFVAGCLDSVLAQDHPDLEVLLVDDGSSDGGADRARGLVDGRLRVIAQAHCGNGRVRAINRGLRESTGEYVVWMSVDHRMTPGRVSRQLERLRQTRAQDPRVGLAFGAGMALVADDALVDASGLPIDRVRRMRERRSTCCVQTHSDDVVRHPGMTLLRRNVVLSGTAMVARKVLEAVGELDESLPRAAEHELWLRILAAGYHTVYDRVPTVVVCSRSVDRVDGALPVVFEGALVQRHYREHYDLHRLIPEYDDLREEERAAFHVQMMDAFWVTGAVDAMTVEDRHLPPPAREAQKERVEGLRRRLDLAASTVVRQNVDGAEAIRVLIPIMRPHLPDRLGQVVRILLEATAGGERMQLWLWLADPTWRDAVTQLVLHGSGAPEGVDLSVLQMVYGPLAESVARVHAVVPLGTLLDFIPIEMARRTGVPVLYRLTSGGVLEAARTGRISVPEFDPVPPPIPALRHTAAAVRAPAEPVLPPRVMIVVPTYNRPRVTRICLGQLQRHKGPASFLVVTDDGSRDLSEETLRLLADHVVMMRANRGIDRLRQLHFEMFWKTDFDFLYFTDNDAFHDPLWLDAAMRLYRRHHMPLGLYNTSYHFRYTLLEKEDVSIRYCGPGISYFLDRAMVGRVLETLPEVDEWPRSWDFVVPEILGNMIFVSRTSYVDHYGTGGLHAELTPDDVAINPTPYLAAARPVVEGLLADPSEEIGPLPAA